MAAVRRSVVRRRLAGAPPPTCRAAIPKVSKLSRLGFTAPFADRIDLQQQRLDLLPPLLNADGIEFAASR